MRPDRVRNVPKRVSQNVRQMRNTFHTFIIPRRSWIMIECRNAEAVSQGRKAAFSTGSQAQGPPQPSVPIERKSHEKSIHLREATIHSLSRRPVASAATAKAKGTADEVKPM